MWDVKALGLTWEVHTKLFYWSRGEGGGISGVAVKCVEIGRNVNGEGSHLASY